MSIRVLAVWSLIGVAQGVCPPEVNGQGAHARSDICLTVPELDRMVRALTLPWTLAELSAHLEATIRHDRPAFLARLWRLSQAYYRYEAACQEVSLLRMIRENLAAIYELDRQKQQRAEIEDVEVLRAHNALLAVDLQLVQQTQTCRLILLEILESAHVLRVDHPLSHDE